MKGSRIKCGINDLETWCMENGERGQLILEEWDVETNWENGFVLTPYDMYCFSDVKVWWKCKKCNHLFYSSIESRVKFNTNCPKCALGVVAEKIHRKAIEKGSCLYDWCQRNGDRGVLLMQEWDEERNFKELGLTINDVAYGSDIKVYWICSKCKSSFMSRIIQRTALNMNCTNCRCVGTSYPEQFLYHALKQLCPQTCNRVKAFEGLEYDIYVPEWNLYIEYGSEYYHKEKADKDTYKKNICVQNGRDFISIIEKNNADETFGEDSVIINGLKKTDKTYINILQWILNKYGHNVDEIDIIGVKQAIAKRMNNRVDDGKDIKSLFPKLAEEWLEELNHGLKPENFSKGSHQIIKWRCMKCGNEWSVSINTRTNVKSGCPKCGYCVFDGRYHVANQTRTKYKVVSMSDFY